MKIINDIDQNTPEWDEFRRGKITGSKLSDIVVKRGNGVKIGFYQLIADRLGIAPDGENVMERGHRLEPEAIEHFENESGKKVETAGMWVADFSDNIAVSPDGAIKNKGKYTEAVEVKCLSSARHIEIIVTNEVPSEYEFQIMQYFIVNEELESLYFISYDPRVIARPYHCIKVSRDDMDYGIDNYKQYQIETLEKIDAIVKELEF